MTARAAPAGEELGDVEGDEAGDPEELEDGLVDGDSDWLALADGVTFAVGLVLRLQAEATRNNAAANARARI